MTPEAGQDRLEELVLKWQDRSITGAELGQLNALLLHPQGRTQLSALFRLEAELCEAMQTAKWRWQSQMQAQRYETLELTQAQDSPAEAQAHPWRAWARWKAWKLIVPVGSLAAGLMLAGLWYRPASGLAQIMAGSKGVVVVRGEKAVEVPPGALDLRVLDRVTVEEGGKATLAYAAENTLVQLRGPAELDLMPHSNGKHLKLNRGSLTARVAPQPADRLMTILTPQAELTVLGTEFTLSVLSNASRLQVIEGALQMARLEDGKQIKVHDGYFAVAGPGLRFAEQPQLPEPWNFQNVGLASRPGHAVVEGRKCRISSWGHQRSRFRPNFNYVYRTLEGDGEIRARVLDFESKDKWTKAGVVIRENLKSGSPTAFLSVKAGRGLEFWSWSKKSSRSDQAGEEEFPYWVRLVRQGDTITAFKSPDGIQWTETGSDRFEMGPKIFVGLGVTSFNPKTSSTAVFDNVSVLSATNPVAVSLFEPPRELDLP